MNYVLSIRASACVSVSDLKKNPSAVMEAAGGKAVAILNHNRPVAYVVPVEEYERMLEALDDADLARIAKQRMGGPSVEVTIDELQAQVSQRSKAGMGQAGFDDTKTVPARSRKTVAKSSGAKRKAA
ncbi:MAG: type II toxin-antitoxin system Phd/YefM family antitoxin [Pseudomonadota bacterium]